MEKLIAKRPVLYQGRIYEPGDTLPAHDAKMVDAWKRAGSAKMTAQPQKAPENAAGNSREAAAGADRSQDTKGAGNAATGQETGKSRAKKVNP